MNRLSVRYLVGFSLLSGTGGRYFGSSPSLPDWSSPSSLPSFTIPLDTNAASHTKTSWNNAYARQHCFPCHTQTNPQPSTSLTLRKPLRAWVLEKSRERALPPMCNPLLPSLLLMSTHSNPSHLYFEGWIMSLSSCPLVCSTFCRHFRYTDQLFS